MAQNIYLAHSHGCEVHVNGHVKRVYDTSGYALVPVEFTQVDNRTVLLHNQNAGVVYVKYFKSEDI